MTLFDLMVDVDQSVKSFAAQNAFVRKGQSTGIPKPPVIQTDESAIDYEKTNLQLREPPTGNA